MAKVFVSYSREDKARVAPIVAFLSTIAEEVWWDDRLVAGEDFTRETERHLNEASAVVVVWTAASVVSKWVLDEAAHGRDAGKLAPLNLDRQTPPLGFRHVHTVDFSGWSGDPGAGCARALSEALRRLSNSGRANSAVPPAVGPLSTPTRLQRPAVVAVAAALAVVAFAALFLVFGRPHTRESLAAAAAERLLKDVSSSDPIAFGARKAFEEIGASGRAADRQALVSLVEGDDARALDLLEKLARELEAAGDKAAAAEAYTRVGAIALLVDMGRGLSARRKAFELSPDSLVAFQSLFLDLLANRGEEAAAAFAEEVIARPGASDRIRGVAYAHLPMVAIDGEGDLAKAEDYLSRVMALRDRTKDPVLEKAALWSAATIEWRYDRLADLEQTLDALDAAQAREPIGIFAPDTIRSRLLYAQGDWEGAFKFATAAWRARREDGRFVPTPLIIIACAAGLNAGLVEGAAPYCAATAGLIDPRRARFRMLTARLAVARGDLEKARSELAASRALLDTGPADRTGIQSDQLAAQAEIAAAGGDLDDAQTTLWRSFDSLEDEISGRSRKATYLRLFAGWAMAAKQPERACTALAESRDLYTAIGGGAGAAAAEKQRLAAGCA